jgi:parvulin-like peptidyl-prolyl isomerase
MGAEVLVKADGELKTGKLSAVLETPRGLYVLKLDGKLEAAKVATEGRMAVARHLYIRFAADEAMRTFADDLIELVKAGNKLELATEELSKKVAVQGDTKERKKDEPHPALSASDKPRFALSDPFSVSGNPLPDVIPKEPLANKAFELEKADDVYPKPIATATGLLVVQLKEKLTAKREDFEKDKWPMLAALRQAKAAEALARYVADLRAAAGSNLVVEAEFGEDPKTVDAQ